MQEAKEMSELLSDVKRGWGSVAGLPGEVEKLRGATEKLESEVRETRRLVAGRAGASGGPRPAGGVTRDCAEQIAAHFIMHCERSGNPHTPPTLPQRRFQLLSLLLVERFFRPHHQPGVAVVLHQPFHPLRRGKLPCRRGCRH